MDSALLGWVVETATNMRISKYMEERLWQPAGMEADAMWLLDGPPDLGREMAGGLFVARLRDYGRFGLLFLNKGRADGRQVVPEAWVTEATQPNHPAVDFGALSDDPDMGYGYQWWLRKNGAYSAQGVYGQLIYIVPEKNVVIVSLSAWPDIWNPDLEFESYAFFEAVAEAVGRL